jgi:hypothetical protein
LFGGLEISLFIYFIAVPFTGLPVSVVYVETGILKAIENGKYENVVGLV